LLRLIEEDIYREYALHDSDIIDISWSTYNQNILLTAGCDNYVCLTDVLEDGLMKKFKHKNMVTGVEFLKSVSHS